MTSQPVITLSRIDATNEAYYQELSQVYETEFAPLTGAVPDARGLYPISTPVDDSHHGYLMLVGGQAAGFIVVQVADEPREVCEFFVAPTYRRRGLGRQLATRVFDMYAGPWVVKQLEAAHKARTFWLGVLQPYTAGCMSECMLHDPRWGRVYQQSFIAVREP